MICPYEEEAYVFSRVVQAARDMVEVEMNCTTVAETDPTIALRSNWSCLSHRIWSGLREGNEALGRVIIPEGHDFDPLTKPSKSYSNRKYVNWSHHAE